MTRRSVEAVLGALNAAGVRYLVAGGLAVVAHGLVRFTADVDIVLDPDPAALERAIEALSALGYAPRAPVAFEDFANAAKRAAWAQEKGLAVFSLHSDAHALTEVDLFLEPPFDFDRAYEGAHHTAVAPGVEATFVSLADLLAMKRAAGRKKDLEDVVGLESLRGEPGDG
jgi:predicted nucleotidyltransferase